MQVIEWGIHWDRLWYKLTGRCNYLPVDVGGWCDTCGRNRSSHVRKV